MAKIGQEVVYCRGIITATSQAMLVLPPTALLHMHGGQPTYVPLFPNCHPANRNICSTLLLLLLIGRYCAAQGPGPPAAVRFQDFPCQGPRRTAGYTSPHSNQQNRAGNHFPLACARGFCTPRRCSQPRRRSARPLPPSADQIRPLGLGPRGLGGAL